MKSSGQPPKNFYITTTLPYVNSEPHLGHALEFIRADAVARYKKLRGFEVFFNTGTDEHGSKIFKVAEAKGESAQKFVDEASEKFRSLLERLGVSPEVNFIRTTDPNHVQAAREFWKTCDRNGFIYKKNYAIKYCVGCELEKTDSELVDGRCPLHPNLDVEAIKEENYFFKWSAFQEKLLSFYAQNPGFVVPEKRFNEIKAFVQHGLQDFSISRLREKMSWGIEVPTDPSQVMYVWFDALVNYVSAVGWPWDMGKFNRWHIESGGMVQYCGKDNLRQQSAMWQAMLMAAGLPNSQKVVIDGFVTGEGGVKMSKSLGNVIDPLQLINDYGTDALRYFCLREVSPFEDTPVTQELFKLVYNANLANGLGNLVSRILTMAEKNLEKPVEPKGLEWDAKFIDAFEAYNLQEASNFIWEKIKGLNEEIQRTEPFKLVKTDLEAAKKIIVELVEGLHEVAVYLEPILPATSAKIRDHIRENMKPEKPLFLRKD